MSVKLMGIALSQALLEYGTVASSSGWGRVGSVRDNLLHWATTHPLEVVLGSIGILVLYKFLRP